jgi:hypothetical protein
VSRGVPGTPVGRSGGDAMERARGDDGRTFGPLRHLSGRAGATRGKELCKRIPLSTSSGQARWYKGIVICVRVIINHNLSIIREIFPGSICVGSARVVASNEHQTSMPVPVFDGTGISSESIPSPPRHHPYLSLSAPPSRPAAHRSPSIPRTHRCYRSVGSHDCHRPLMTYRSPFEFDF